VSGAIVKRFALIGASGYIAPRHLKAIGDTGNTLVAALDPFDSVGVLDSYFPSCDFFTQPELFERHLEQLHRAGRGVEVVSICSPNHLHDAHIRMALRNGADALCEKPLVLQPEEIHALQQLEQETGRRVWTVLQLRTHSALIALKKQLESEPRGIKEVTLSYVTGRGQWYLKSWKGRLEHSGGLATNIGVHFFDLLTWLFGPVQQLEVHMREDTAAAGYLQLERARVRWFLSIDAQYVPAALREKGQRTYRSITVDGQELEFSEGFTDLHTEVYRQTLAGQGFGMLDTLPAIEAVAHIRSADVRIPSSDTAHPWLAAS
jgi:UDP-N-acetyl-2-amino-2-deoxyglucuronate dehydrogenase